MGSIICKRWQFNIFDIFGVEHNPKETKKFRGNKTIALVIYRIKANNSIMCAYFCTGFVTFMLKGKNMLDYTNLFSPSEYERMIKEN